MVKAAWSQCMSCVHKRREMSLGYYTLVGRGAPSSPTAQLSREWSMLQSNLVGKALSPGVAGVTPVPVRGDDRAPPTSDVKREDGDGE